MHSIFYIFVFRLLVLHKLGYLFLVRFKSIPTPTRMLMYFLQNRTEKHSHAPFIFVTIRQL